MAVALKPVTTPTGRMRPVAVPDGADPVVERRWRLAVLAMTAYCLARLLV